MEEVRLTTVSTPGTHLTSYRPDIDGLRSIAVLSVVLHHLSGELLPGGFVGVDIFFVISGFLITAQIYKEIGERSFSIKQFYKRRINRIVPALTTVIFCTLCVGTVLLSPADLVLFAKSALASVLGLSNLFFWREYGNYFASNSAEAPLLHTWSLGVEEQFYLIWPLLLVLIAKLFHRRILLVTAILLMGTFAASEAGTRIAISASYYLLPTRFFELLAGGFLALMGTRYQPRTTLQSGASFTTGLALILGSLIYIDRNSTFPGINALWPCLGSALLIWSGQHKCRLHKVLTNRPMVFIGLISYSLYLWHWPLIAYLNYLGVPINLVSGTGVMAGALLLAWLSWRFVEMPARRQGVIFSTSKVVVRRLLVPASALVAVNAAVAYTSGFPQRFDPQVSSLEANLNSKPNELRSGCHVPTALYDTPPSEKCRLGARKTELDGILIGDSFANHFTGMLDVIAKHSDIALMDYTMDGCPPIEGYDTGKIPAYVKRCKLRNELTYAHLEKQKYRHVILAANWPEAPETAPLLTNSINRILATGAQLTIILNNETIENTPNCTIRNIMYHRNHTCNQRPLGRAPYLELLKTQFPTANYIDPNSIICKNNSCKPVLNGILIYRDSAHLNDIGSRLLGEELLSAGIRIAHNDSLPRSTTQHLDLPKE